MSGRRKPWSVREWMILTIALVAAFPVSFALGAFIFQQTQGCS